MNILRTEFHVTLTNTLDHNTLSRFTDHYSRGDFLKCTTIPVHIRDHRLLCIIDPLYETIDSLRKNNSYVTSNILRWYQTELTNHD
jgi:hypothetical protein